MASIVQQKWMAHGMFGLRPIRSVSYKIQQYQYSIHISFSKSKEQIRQNNPLLSVTKTSLFIVVAILSRVADI